MGSKKDKSGSNPLRDQLLQWKKTHEAPPPTSGKSDKKTNDPKSKASPALAKGGAAPEPEPERPLSDVELFQQAVDSVSDKSAAILQKYDRTDARPQGARREEPAEPGQVTASDHALFLQAVGELTPLDVERAKPGGSGGAREADVRFAKRVQRGEVEPRASIDLHGDDRERAKERLVTFLNLEARTRTDVVLVVHGKGKGILASEVAEILDEHPAVAEHVVAPPRMGGDGARLARLKNGPKNHGPKNHGPKQPASNPRDPAPKRTRG